MKKNENIGIWVGSIIACFCAILVILITSIEIGAYSDWNFYEKEYNKYQVLEDVGMEMPEVMHVTKEMMSYLRGNRETLVIDTIVKGEEREFFNGREISHMEDVRALFIGGLRIRMISFILFFSLVLFFITNKKNWRQIFPRAFQYTVIGLAAITAIVAGLFASNFDKYFTKFHEIFFANDLWLLDPTTDLLINILPQGFFVDIAIRIGLFFAVGLVACFALATGVRVRNQIRSK